MCGDSNGSYKLKVRVVKHLFDPWFVKVDPEGGIVSVSNIPARGIDLENFRIDGEFTQKR